MLGVFVTLKSAIIGSVVTIEAYPEMRNIPAGVVKKVKLGLTPNERMK